MTIPIAAMLLLSAGSLFTLPLLLKKFRAIEIISCYMIISILIEQVYTIVTLNLEMIRPAGTLPVFWLLNMELLIFSPCATLWLFYSYFESSLPLFFKGILTIGWLLGMFGIELLFRRLGFLAFIHWHIGFAFIEWFAVLVPSALFIQWFRNLLRRESAL